MKVKSKNYDPTLQVPAAVLPLEILVKISLLINKPLATSLINRIWYVASLEAAKIKNIKVFKLSNLEHLIGNVNASVNFMQLRNINSKLKESDLDEIKKHFPYFYSNILIVKLCCYANLRPKANKNIFLQEIFQAYSRSKSPEFKSIIMKFITLHANDNVLTLAARNFNSIDNRFAAEIAKLGNNRYQK